jgi:hypothetical protein
MNTELDLEGEKLLEKCKAYTFTEFAISPEVMERYVNYFV